ncbi:MAG: hypothetical protein Q8M24_15625 [Pseudolabrys sp.]|nr:hypothetical protein [Pseudolabrys sp.]MDP2296872.1 hypothetical protein [Pseudolabrys sp.]
MSETFLVPFDYDVHLAPRSSGAGKTALRRATAAIEIPAAGEAELPVAYRVEHRRDLGPGHHVVLRHKDKHWWPLVDRVLGFHTRDARDFLQELRAGQCDLFVRRCLDDHHLDNHRRRPIVHEEYDTTLAAVRRSARTLLIVGDQLYAAGGSPLVVDASSGIRIAGTGADRAIPAAAGDLRIKAANGHVGGSDLAICRGRFFLPGSSDLAAATRYRPSDFHGVRVATLDGEVVDPLAVRLDAAFRTAWRAINKSIARTQPEGFTFLWAEFLEACRPAEDGTLTAARYFALRSFVDLFQAVERRPVAVGECLVAVRQTIDAATRAPRFNGLPRPDFRPSLNETEEAALACLA